MTEHPFPPLFDENSHTLILGSFPSVKSREQGFFYGHPQNRFWRVLAQIYGEAVPDGIAEKRALILGRGLALWDVLARCDINGSADSSIRRAEPNDLSPIFSGADIRRIFVNGRTAEKYYKKFAEPLWGPAAALPSTSPANAAWTLPRLVEAWRVIAD